MQELIYPQDEEGIPPALLVLDQQCVLGLVCFWHLLACVPGTCQACQAFQSSWEVHCQAVCPGQVEEGPAVPQRSSQMERQSLWCHWIQVLVDDVVPIGYAMHGNNMYVTNLMHANWCAVKCTRPPTAHVSLFSRLFVVTLNRFVQFVYIVYILYIYIIIYIYLYAL